MKRNTPRSEGGRLEMEAGTVKCAKRRTAISNDTCSNYYSVEFSVAGLRTAYQFKIWKDTPENMYVMVKEESEILEKLRVGDILNMKYYSSDESDPFKYHATTIPRISREMEGRLKGHYLVGLEIM
jgi:hypothetical protein